MVKAAPVLSVSKSSHQVPIGRNGFLSFGERIRSHGQSDPEKAAIICDADRRSYGELLRRAEACAGKLQANGLTPGGQRRVGIMAANCLDYAVLILGCQLIGVAVVPLPGLIGPDAQAQMARDADLAILFFDSHHGEKALECARLAGDDITTVMIGASRTGAAQSSLDDWLADAPDNTPVIVEPDWASDIIYSSGTTGTPKGIVQSYNARAQQCISLEAIGRSAAQGLLNTVGLYSNFGMAGFLLTLWWGGGVFMMSKFSAAESVRVLASEMIGLSWLAPATLIRIIEEPAFEAAVREKQCVKLCAGAPLSAAQKQRVLDDWPGPFYDLYGQTETGTLTLLALHDAPAVKFGSVGMPLSSVTVCILDNDGHPAPVGEEGEIVGQTSSMMSGYHRLDDATATVYWHDANGHRFVKTGDVGKFDTDGYLWLCDRKKDMIISGGFNVYPADIERILQEHPAVFEAAVVGFPSAKWGESPVAFVTLRGGHTEKAQTLQAWVNERVAPIQRVTAVQLLATLPKGTLGKVLKRELRETHASSVGELP